MKYLALGDSYTIGEAVKPEERWSHILVDILRENGTNIQYPKIIAKTGWTTDELLQAIEEEKIDEKFDFVTLLIGVNNQYRNYPIEQFEKEFEELLVKSISFASNNSQKVVVVSIPDYGFTPFSKEKGLNSAFIAKEIKNYNAVSLKVCKKHNVKQIDIFEISQKANENNAYLAEDLLHFSGKMYEIWANEIFSEISNLLIK